MKKMNKAVTVLALLAMTMLGACGGNTSSATSSAAPATSSSGGTTPTSSSKAVASDFYVEYKGSEYATDGAATVTVGDATAMIIPSMLDGSDGTFTYTSSDADVITVSTNGKLTVKKPGTAKVTVTDANNNSITLTFTASASEVSSGGRTYTTVSYDEKSRILASLEKYAVDNYLTGITIFSNGSKIAYNTRYIPQSAKYISGYGWGTTREGELKEPLTKALSKKTTYYNIGTTSLPSHANAMNASGSDVSSVYDYISNSYYSTRMNQTQDGYEWYPSLATCDKPIPVSEPTANADGTVKEYGKALSTEDAHYNNNNRWRIYLRDDVVYRSGSSNEFSKSYDGKKVALEDYLTPLKFMLTSYNAQYRGAELTTGISGFAGSSNYYSSTSTQAADSTDLWDEAKWKEYMGTNIFTGTEDGKNFIEFNLLAPCTQFYAMYYLSSSLYSPLPEAFIKHWTAKYLGKYPDTYTPCDTMLSTGPYYIESWDKTKLITFKKNDQYYWKEDTFKTTVDGQTTETTRKAYNIDGIAYNAVEDSSQLVNHFLAGEIDSYAPKAEEMTEGKTFASDNGSNSNMSWRLYETLGDSNFKLNVNAATDDQWKERFGPTGSIYQHTAGSNYYTNTWKPLNKRETGVKPYMSNIHFLNFLSFAINRKEICEARGSKPTQEYFSDNYLIDPEAGVSYNSTAAHKAVLADRYNDNYGFNETYATSELRKAFSEVIEDLAKAKAFSTKKSTGTAGSSENPYVVPIDMEWMNSTDKTDYADVFTYVKKVFATVSDEDYGGGYVLDIQETSGNSDYEEVYNLMRRGEFDLGFGSITGNSLNPLNFVEVLKSDNSSGFTLNWGPDTAKMGDGLYSGDDEYRNHIYYDGKEWSYDTLWKAADTGVVLDNKGAIAVITNESTSKNGNFIFDSVNNDAQSVTFKLSFEALIQAGATIESLMLSNTASSKAYQLEDLDVDSNGLFSLTVGSEFNNDGTTDYNTLTATVTFSANLTDSNGQQVSTDNLTSTITLPTYLGATSK